MFGRHTSTITDPDGTVVDERGERYVRSHDDGTRTETGPGSDEDTGALRRPDGVFDDRTETSPAGEPVAEPVPEPVAEPVAETKRWAHVSGTATLSLIIGTLAVAATLTGLLAPLGFAAGVLAILVGIVALYAIRRPAVTGHTLVGLGVLFGLVAIVLSVLAMNNSLSWLSSNTDQIATVHNWLNDHLHWLRRW